MNNSTDVLSLELKKNDVGEETTLALRSTFMPFFEEANELAKKAKAIVVTSENQTDDMTAARDLRLALKTIRVDAEKKRKALKEEVVRKGKAIDGLANIIKYLIVPVEEHLQEQEDFVKVREARRKEELRAKRDLELREFDMSETDIACYNLSEMSEEGYQQLRSSWKMTFENKLKLEREEEERRIATQKAQVEERVKIAAENEKLKADAEENRKKAQEKLAKERAKAKSERQYRERLETAIEAKRLAEEQKKREAKEAEAKAQQAPDKEKLHAIVTAVSLSIGSPELKSKEAKAVLAEFVDNINKAVQALLDATINL